MKEIWKKTKYKGLDVSNMGRVRSYFENRHLRDKPQKILKGTKGSHGYFQIGTEKKIFLVHRIVMETFKGKSKFFVLHKNGKRTDNRLSNLKFGTQYENIQDKKKHGTYFCGHNHPMSKLNRKTVLKIRKLKGKISQRALAKKFNVSQSVIGDCLTRKTWGQY